MAQPVPVIHSSGSYSVHIEPGILARLDTLVREQFQDRRIIMLADAAVHELVQTGRLGPVNWKGETLTVPTGERSKSRDTWSHLTDELLNRGFGRDSALVGLGGGVLGDLAGFVAATYMRGLPYILVPTTLLAMLDASVGGKTGVNAPQGKNLIGAFHQPAAVLADPRALTTLPEREYRSGLAEAVKHGLIADAGYFDWIAAHAPEILRREPEILVHLVRRSVEIKAEVVRADERESGRRAILNAGHTVGHALERVSDYQLTHGEAVALGLVVECAIAERIGVAPSGLHQQVVDLLQRLGLPTRLSQPLDPRTLIPTMELDKKNRGAQIHFALARSLGEMDRRTGWTTPVDIDDISAGLTTLWPPWRAR